MSPENQGVFWVLKEVTFRRILAFCNSWEGCLSCASYWLVGLVRKKWNYDCNPAVAFFDNTREAGMMCETAAKWTEGMEGNGGALPKWWGEMSF